MRAANLLLFSLLHMVLVGCWASRAAGGNGHDSTYHIVDTAALFHPDSAVCGPHLGQLTLTHDSVGPFPLHGTFQELLGICSSAERDIYSGTGGWEPPALYFRFPGILLAAVDTFGESPQDTIVMSHTPGLWAVSGDSLLLPDGKRFPRNLGELRERFPQGVLYSDKRDDSDGVTARVCELPDMLFEFDYDTPTPSEVGEWAFSAKAASDSEPITHALLWIGGPWADSSCAKAGVSAIRIP